jgi:hypothetical protein
VKYLASDVPRRWDTLQFVDCGIGWFITEKGYESSAVSVLVGLGVYVPEPQSTYRDRGDIRAVHLTSLLECTLQLRR